MTGQVSKWQKTIDTGFPHGAIASWLREDSREDTVYSISWIQVTGMSGLHPILKLYVFGADRVLDGLVCLSWEAKQEEPLIIVARFAAEEFPMQLAADVPERLAVLMDAARAQLIAANPLPVPAV